MNKNAIVIYDFETTGPDPRVCYPTQLAAIAIDSRNFEIYEGGEFNSLMRVTKEELDSLDQKKLNEALKLTRKNRDELIAAPPPDVIFTEFVQFCYRFSASKNYYDVPILCGHNILNFDNIILKRLAEKYGYLDNRGDLKFASSKYYDTLQEWFWWTESLAEPGRYGADDLRRYTGMETEGAHDAYFDVFTCYEWFKTFMWKRRRMVDPALPVSKPRGNIFKDMYKEED